MDAETIGTTCNITSSGTVTTATDKFATDLAFIDFTHYDASSQRNITLSGLVAVDNATSYFGTAGTIAGVALLLTIVIGAFYFVSRRNKGE